DAKELIRLVKFEKSCDGAAFESALCALRISFCRPQLWPRRPRGRYDRSALNYSIKGQVWAFLVLAVINRFRPPTGKGCPFLLRSPVGPIGPALSRAGGYRCLTGPMERNNNPAGDARQITIRGAREHNLKNIDVAIPRDKLVVFTGLSGSGKSSLAFDTIYAEGQRRYVESLSAYARQFLEMMQKPDVDQIDGLSPAISIEQKTTSKNPRSTVGTVTEIYDYMRLLWARIGVPYSPATGLPIESQTVSQMVDRILALPEGTRLYLLAPVVRGRKGEYRKELADFLKRGYQPVKVDGKFYGIAEVPALDKKFTHDIDVVVDRIVVRPDLATRLADSLEQALKLADGLAIAELADGAAVDGAKANRQRNETAERLVFSEK